MSASTARPQAQDLGLEIIQLSRHLERVRPVSRLLRQRTGLVSGRQQRPRLTDCGEGLCKLQTEQRMPSVILHELTKKQS